MKRTHIPLAMEKEEEEEEEGTTMDENEEWATRRCWGAEQFLSRAETMTPTDLESNWHGVPEYPRRRNRADR